MKFVLTSAHLFWWPVIVRVPDEEVAGRFAEQRLEVQFDVPDQDEELAYQDAYAEATSLRERADMEMARLRAFTRDWRGVVDDTGADVPLTDATLDVALRQPWFRAGLYTALAESLSGKDARLGN